MAAGKLLGLAAVAANSAAVDLAAVGESEEEEETCNWSREGSGDATGLYEEGSEEDDEEDDGVGGKRKRMSVDDRKARNRERNRLHARKTRQRKKQHVQELQLKIWGLRQERQRLLQLSTEHRTAGVLLALSCSPKQCVQRAGTGSSSSSSGNSTSPRLPPTLKLTKTAATPAVAIGSTRDWSREVASHEEALRKITQEFERMDGSQQVGGEEDELAAAGAAGTNVGRSRAQSSASSTSSIGGSGAGGGKGGSRGVKGTLADRTALRRERNRMHAKRTRNRKKLFVEACSVMIDKMKVENAQLEYEIQASGIHLPQDNWVEEVRETVPEEPLPEYLAALWDFAEGKNHSPKTPASGASTTATLVTPPATPVVISEGAIRQSRRTSSSSSSSSSSSFSCATSLSPSCGSSSSYSTSRRQRPVVSTTTTSKAPRQPPSPPPSTGSTSVPASSKRPAAVLSAAVDAVDAVAASTPGQALEDATALCAFMEAAQTRSVKRGRVTPPSQQQQGAKQQHTQPRGWSSDHGSTTSESRGGSEFSEEDSAFERKSAEGSNVSSSSEASAVLSPAFWTSRQVLERYVLPRQQQLPEG